MVEFVVTGSTGIYTYFDVTAMVMCAAMDVGGAQSAVTVHFGLGDAHIG